MRRRRQYTTARVLALVSVTLAVAAGSVAPALGQSDDGTADVATMSEIVSHEDYGSGWKLTAGLAVTEIRGNTEASSLAPNVGVTIVGADWGVGVTAEGKRLEKDAEDIAESYEGHVVVHRRLIGNITWITLNDTERDRFKGLDLRSTLGTGLSWLAQDGDVWKLTVAGGAAWEHEDFVPATGVANDDYVTLNLYVKNSFALSASSTLTQTASSNIGNDGRRLDGDVKLETAVTGWLDVVLSYEFEHDNDPLLDTFDQTDRTFTASLNVNIGSG
jgi:putative salt-induced outer membrane protein YdiY